MSDYLPDGTPLPEGQKYHDLVSQHGMIVGPPFDESFSTPLMEISSSVMPLSIVFDVVAYLDRDHSETEMFDMIQRLRKACDEDPS